MFCESSIPSSAIFFWAFSAFFFLFFFCFVLYPQPGKVLVGPKKFQMVLFRLNMFFGNADVFFQWVTECRNHTAKKK